MLCQHSSYFRTHTEPLISGQRCYSADECSDHPNIPHCIRVPDRCGKVAATADDFRLFLCHLYFACHYRCIPYTVVKNIDFAAQPTSALMLDSPKFVMWQHSFKAPSTVVCESEPTMLYKVLSLAHYFDCAQLLSRAEDNMLLVLKAETVKQRSDEWASESTVYLELATRFGLRHLKTTCLSLVAAENRSARKGSTTDRNIAWEKFVEQQDKTTLIELLRAMCSLPQSRARARTWAQSRSIELSRVNVSRNACTCRMFGGPCKCRH